MSKKILRIIWWIIVLAFIAMVIYHLIRGNYKDLLIGFLLLIILVTVIGVYYLIKNKKVLIKVENYRLVQILIGITTVYVLIAGIVIGGKVITNIVEDLVVEKSVLIKENLVVNGHATATEGFVVGTDEGTGTTALLIGNSNDTSEGCITLKVLGPGNKWIQCRANISGDDLDCSPGACGN